MKLPGGLAVVTLAVFLFLGCAAPGTLKPFRSDGCSCFPEGTSEYRDLWLHCCIEHDKAYWRGGTREERLAADRALRNCVAACGKPDIAELMLLGVRVGGAPWWPTSFRWGYGWPYPRGYHPLTAEEKALADEMLKAFEASHVTPVK